MNLKRFIVLFAAALGLLTACVENLNEPNDVNNVLSNVDAQVEAVEKSAEDMKALNEALGECSVNVDEAEKAISQHLASLKKGASLEAATLATLELQKKVAAVVGAAEGAVLFEEGYAKNFKKLFEDVNNGAAMWLGESFSAYYPVAVAQAKADYVLADLNSQIEDQQLYVDALMSDIEAGLRKDENPEELTALAASVAKMSQKSESLSNGLASMAQDLENEYKAAFSSEPGSFDNEGLVELNASANLQTKAADETLASLAAEVKTCKETLANLQERLGDVEADVNELLGMIQSVTFMSEFSSEYAYAYYNMDLNTKVNDTALPYNGKAVRTATGTMDLTYMVRPAAAAKALNANLNAVNVNGYYANTIATKAPLASDYIDFEVIKVAVVNETRGLVTVTVKPELREAFYYKEIGAKCALSVQTGKTDVTSKFVEILPKENSNRVYVQSIATSKQEIYMKKGEYADVTATINPDNVSTPGYYLTSSDTRIIRLDDLTGKLYGVGVGTATITATSKGTDEWGLPVSATCTVNVEEAFMLTGAPYVEVGNTTQLFLTYPTDAIIDTKVWSSSDESKLTVDADGKVTGVSHSYNTVTKEYNDVTVSCTINGVTTVSWNMKVAAVQPKKIITNDLSDNQGEVTVRVNESLSLASTIYPDNIPSGAYKINYQSDQGLGWINFDTGVINANKNSHATTAWVTITVENYDKERYYVSDARVKRVIAVKVLPYYVKTIQLDDVNLELGQDATLSPRFTSDVTGKQPTNTAVTWTSSNTSVATVDQNGKVTSVAGGTATITATSTDGSNVSGSCIVTVTERWKDFNVGDYVVITSSGDIEFSADLNTAKSKGTVVGVVIIQTNPRVTDTELPSNCTHGIAIGLTETANVKWQASASNVGQWLEQNKGYNYLKDTGRICGYSNTLGLKAYNAVCASDNKVLPADCAPNIALGSATSGWYLPSYAELNMLFEYEQNSRSQMISNGAIASKIVAAGGTPFSITTKNYNTPDGTQDAPSYWASTESFGSSSWATGVHFLYGGFTNKSKSSKSYYIARYVFAF